MDPGPLEHLSLNSLAEAAQKLESAQNSRLDNVRILLAEDCIDNQFLVCAFLTKVGAQVDVVDNGKKAVEMAQTKKYDVILMDIQMPVMDGYEATSQLRKSGYKSPIIALTAHALKGEREHCLSLGFDEHNTKPINRNALINSVTKTLAHFKH